MHRIVGPLITIGVQVHDLAAWQCIATDSNHSHQAKLTETLELCLVLRASCTGSEPNSSPCTGVNAPSACPPGRHARPCVNQVIRSHDRRSDCCAADQRCA